MLKFLILLYSFTKTSFSQGLLGTGLEISASGDMVYNQRINSQSEADDKLSMRGAEIMLYSATDHLFDGRLSAAAHDERGETVFELHELFISSTKLVPRSNIKIGQFFLGIGRLNRFHQHDWVFTHAPKVHSLFFDDEGVFDSGLEYNYLLSLKHNINLTAGLTSGYRYGHSHTSGSKPKAPTHYTRLSSFTPFSTTSGLETGLNYLGRTDAQGKQLKISGIDFTAKWRRARILKFMTQSELWYKSTQSNSVKTEEVGMYLFNQFALGLQSSLGLRLDGYKNLTKLNSLTNKKINHISYGATAQTTFRPSEFTNFRLSLSHHFDREEGRTTFKDTKASLQFVFILGSHPAHEF